MNISKLPRYVTRSMQLGPVKTVQIIQQRIQHRFFDTYWRYKAHKHRPGQSWSAIGFKGDIAFFKQSLQRRKLSFVKHVYPELDNPTVLAQADLFVQKTFNLLGSGSITFAQLPWHRDFRLQAQQPDADVTFDPGIYYKDIPICAGQGSELTKDIKVPWELSRCQHLYVLGRAYEITGDCRYAQTIIEHTHDWIDNNPFLKGPNWVCPMEVGIRAVNWIIALQFVYALPDFPSDWFTKITASLYDHMTYLENNWEIYDGRTSNHYLSDLLGYYYLCYFFADVEGMALKQEWCYQELLKEFSKQVFQEGTDYEGSTAYHGLVTEIFYLFYCVCKEQRKNLPDVVMGRLHAMFDYMAVCTTQGGSRIQIGDNDSGTILYYGLLHGVVEKMQTPAVQQPVHHYCQAGLSVIKTLVQRHQWHITVRHHAYETEQPSGHFHNDAGSITLALDGNDLFVDPGSYLYTPSVAWRNQFRSVWVHNSFFIEDCQPVPFDERLFALEVPRRYVAMNEITGADQGELRTHHDLYASRGLRAQRSVILKDMGVTICDSWHALSVPEQPLISCWNLTLAPDIMPLAQDHGWDLYKASVRVASLLSDDLVFTVCPSWYSPGYGSKVPTLSLQARLPIQSDRLFVSTLQAR